MLLSYVLIFSLLGSVGALTGAGALVAFPKLHNRLKTILLASAVGTLLGATFIGLLPEAMADHSPRQIGLIMLGGGCSAFFCSKIFCDCRMPTGTLRSNTNIRVSTTGHTRRAQ